MHIFVKRGLTVPYTAALRDGIINTDSCLLVKNFQMLLCYKSSYNPQIITPVWKYIALSGHITTNSL